MKRKGSLSLNEMARGSKSQPSVYTARNRKQRHGIRRHSLVPSPHTWKEGKQVLSPKRDERRRKNYWKMVQRQRRGREFRALILSLHFFTLALNSSS